MPVRLGTYIRERRQDLGLTQEQLAERMGEPIRQSDVSRLEAGRITLPRRLRMEQLASALDVSLGDLLLHSGWAGGDLAMDEPPSAPEGPHDALMEQLEARNDVLESRVDALQCANQRLRDQHSEKGVELRTAEAVLAQLRAVLNALSDPVVVIDRTGLIVAENTAYLAFSARHTNAPVMRDPQGVPLACEALPLARAARGDSFALTVFIEERGGAVAYRIEGRPASTVHRGMIGVVTIRSAP